MKSTNWQFEYRREDKTLKITVEGAFSVEECLKMREDFLSSGSWQPGTNLLLDYRKADLSRIKITDQRVLAENHAANKERYGRGKMAVLVESTRDFGLARQYEIIVDDQILSVMMVFKTEGEAVGWLNSDRSTSFSATEAIRQ